jgi:hypothetical protein
MLSDTDFLVHNHRLSLRQSPLPGCIGPYPNFVTCLISLQIPTGYPLSRSLDVQIVSKAAGIRVCQAISITMRGQSAGLEIRFGETGVWSATILRLGRNPITWFSRLLPSSFYISQSHPSISCLNLP